MPNRIIREDILTSESVDMLDPPAEVFYRRLMSKVDDHGLYDARPAILKSHLYPLRHDRVREADISRWMAACQKAGLIVLYSHDGKPYLQMLKTKWKARSEPKYPLPTVARNCTQLQTTAPLVVDVDVVVVEDVVVDKPASGDATNPEPKKSKGAKLTFDGFVAACQAEGVDLIPADDPVYAYAERIGLPDDLIALAWTWFAKRYADKRQTGIRGWRQAFRNAVEGNWPKLWYRDDASNSWALTTAGKQAQLEASNAG